MRVLITGATGLIGSRITQLCYDKGIDVNYLTTDKSKINKQHHYSGFYWQPEKGEINVDCFEDVDAIIHLAGANLSKRWTDSYKKEIIDSRTKSAQLLFDSLKNNKYQIKQIISASAIGIYPSSLEKLYFEDETAVDDSFVGDVVVKWEEAVNQFKNLGLEVAKIRIGMVLAEAGGALKEIKKPVALNMGAPLGSGKQWQSWIHIQDVSQIFLYVLEKELTGIYNAAAPNPVTNKELINAIAAKMDKRIWLPAVPKPVLKAVFGEMATLVLTSQLVSSYKIEKNGYTFRYVNLAKALDDLL